MTDAEMVALVQTLVGDSRFNALAEPYLALAKDAVVNRLFPYREEASWVDVPEKFHARTCEIACYLINKRGAEGETQHSENGVTRTYEAASIPASMFSGMTPFAGVPAASIGAF